VLGQVAGEVRWGTTNRGGENTGGAFIPLSHLARLAKRRLNFVGQVIGWPMDAFVGPPVCSDCLELFCELPSWMYQVLLPGYPNQEDIMYCGE
jgi:hypothetical protein